MCRLLTAIALGAALLLAGPAGNDPEKQLQAAINKEVVEGDLAAAVELYRTIIVQNGGNRPIAARALLRLAGCYEKLGQTEAEKTYRQLINDYADQTAEVTLARTRLAALTTTTHEASSVPALRLLWKGTDTDSSGEISPDGRLLAYVNWDTGDVAVRDLRSGQSRMMTNKGGHWETDDFGNMPRWSPDGKQLAYYWYRDDGDLNELRVIDLSGKNMRVVFSDRQRGLSPVGWFPDGSALVAVELKGRNVTDIVRVAVSNGAISDIRRITSIGTRRVCLSPDRRYIAFEEAADSASLNRDVLVMPSSGGRALAVVTGPYDDRLLDWTPDGSRIFFASNRSGSYDGWLVPVREGNAVGSPQLLRKDLGLIAPIGFSPDGAFYFEPNLKVHDIFVADWSPESQKAASAPVLATEHFSGATSLPAWAPDGRRLAYLVTHGDRRPAERWLRVRDMETGTERALAHVDADVGSLSWSPDGVAVGMTDRRVLQVASADSGKVIREIATKQNRQGIWFFAWGPDAAVVYLVTGGESSTLVIRHDLRTGSETCLYTGAPGVPVDIAVSPDGRQVAVVHGRRIIVIPATGGEPRQLVAEAPGRRSSQALTWSPDGRYVYFGRVLDKDNEVVRLYRVPASGGVPEDLNLEVGGELRFRPDGRQLAFTRGRGFAVGEVWVMEHFLPAVKR